MDDSYKEQLNKILPAPIPMMIFNGFQVYKDDGLDYQLPTKRHKQKSWDKRGSYHKRVQKKWTKMYGYSEHALIYERTKMVMSTPMFTKLVEWIDKQDKRNLRLDMQQIPKG